MNMMELKIKDEFIKLGQALKLAGIASSGIEAKILSEDGLALVNGETETRMVQMDELDSQKDDLVRKNEELENICKKAKQQIKDLEADIAKYL